MKSPCTGTCTTGLGDDVCRGCGRTLEEITSWAALSDAERARVMDRLEGKE